MRGCRWIAAAAMLSIAVANVAWAQDKPTKNPLEGNPEALKGGMGLFRTRCAACHGVDARGVRGPDLTGVWGAGASDTGLFETVQKGRPGTEMPPGLFMSDEDIWKTLAYLKTLSATPAPVSARGNAANGERIFSARCSRCHQVDGRGGRLGPDLTRIGLTRARAALTNQIRGALEDLPSGYEPVTLTTPQGRAIRGVKKNEDVFSVQIMDTTERIQGYLRSDLREVRDEKRSLMPKFGPEVVNESDLDDLLSYLATLRGPAPSTTAFTLPAIPR
jgi:cytochrome c oxidase cbb3-type subunit III